MICVDDEYGGCVESAEGGYEGCQHRQNGRNARADDVDEVLIRLHERDDEPKLRHGPGRGRVRG